jgi:AsmA protein
MTLREIASTLNGRAKLTSDGGEIENGGLTFLYGSFFEELFRSLNPFAEKESKTELICLAFVVEATDGMVETSPGLVMQTDKMNIISKGKLDLKTEKINFNFNTAARKGIGISAGEFVNPYIRVGGSLARPRLAFDAPSAVVTTGAAVMTMGISILATAAAKRVFRKKDPCGAVLAQAEKEIAKQAEKQAKENAKQAEKSTEQEPRESMGSDPNVN